MLWAMADLANLFSWSRSRAGMFEECRRRYYYHYYGAWGGWDSSAPPDIRRLYVLKQLTGRQGWAGRTVHSAVELVLRVLHAGEELSESRLIEDTVGVLVATCSRPCLPQRNRSECFEILTLSLILSRMTEL